MKSFKVGKTPKKNFTQRRFKKKFACFILATCVYLLFIIVCYLHPIISTYIYLGLALGRVHLIRGHYEGGIG